MTTNERYWEIDSLRGIAIVMMVLYHLLYDLSFFAGYAIEVLSGFWLYFARATATLFLLVVGISLTLSAYHARSQNKKLSFVKQLKRGLFVFAFGLLITLATRFIFPEQYVRFGILHLIGVSIILAYPFLSFGILNLIGGMAIIGIGFLLKQTTFSFPWLLWLGFRPEHFATIDYFPLFPWFGVVLIGIFLGNLLYTMSGRRFSFPDFSSLFAVRLLSFLGKHSLLIYLFHQPFLVLLLSVVGVVPVSLLIQ
ncbi:DUF1624 domain-containing protein [Candidatus Woesearchaeota archaeon]|nr:DUF1624 domain-containing protein [Candidatus Woesearchaeota archaeon]